MFQSLFEQAKIPPGKAILVHVTRKLGTLAHQKAP